MPRLPRPRYMLGKIKNFVRIEALQALLRVAPMGSDEYKGSIAALCVVALL